jgi:hypothetical protein
MVDFMGGGLVWKESWSGPYPWTPACEGVGQSLGASDERGGRDMAAYCSMNDAVVHVGGMTLHT